MATVRLLGLSGSFRRASFCTAILATMARRLRPGDQLTTHDYQDLPFYNEDHDVPDAPPAVASLRAAIHAADGLVVVTPEFNHGIPGVLKNALDWASRPRGAASLAGKPVVTVTASPATTGGVRAHAQLNETFLAVGARLVVRPQAVIGLVHHKFRDGDLVDEAALGFLDDAVNHLREYARG